MRAKWKNSGRGPFLDGRMFLGRRYLVSMSERLNLCCVDGPLSEVGMLICYMLVTMVECCAVQLTKAHPNKFCPWPTSGSCLSYFLGCERKDSNVLVCEGGKKYTCNWQLEVEMACARSAAPRKAQQLATSSDSRNLGKVL